MPSINDHKFNCLPRIAAQLLFEGFPIEIYDGDASHVPQKWISAILNSLSEIINISNFKIFTLSVLGVQSTGKSTLLNTLFGTQFRVSAGRCTRGAFMQLIPLHKSIWMKVSVHYILIIDTEGLRTPECKRSDNIHEHDNELATFVIGMADLTLITVHGESLGEMQDILLTAVHAFLRMYLVQLKPSCYIIHQNSFEIDVYKRVDAQYGDWSWGFKKEMIEWEKNAHYKLMSCTEEELEHVIRELTKSLHDDVENLYIKYKTLINGFFNANKN